MFTIHKSTRRVGVGDGSLRSERRWVKEKKIERLVRRDRRREIRVRNNIYSEGWKYCDIITDIAI